MKFRLSINTIIHADDEQDAFDKMSVLVRDLWENEINAKEFEENGEMTITPLEEDEE